MTMEIVLASRNRGKAAELSALLAGLPIRIRTLDEFPSAGEVEEDGATFAENAVKKALAALSATGLPALADDSGLEVDALGGRPGVFSARFAGIGADDRSNREELLRSLEGVPEPRTARFRCVIALAHPGGRVETVEGSCEGVITREPRGEGGFGYDPLFFFPSLGRTFAELGPGEKHAVSHRGKAMRAMAGVLQGLLGGTEGGG
jgi:XTP/dITP diphosphohydrolase